MSQSTYLLDPRHVGAIGRERLAAKKLKASSWWKAKRLRGICDYCGQNTPGGALTLDHIVPLARGGAFGKKELRGRLLGLQPVQGPRYTR